MHVAQGHAYPANGELMLVTDKRGQRLKPARREDRRLAIAELGSKAIYEVYAEQFLTVTPYP